MATANTNTENYKASMNGSHHKGLIDSSDVEKFTESMTAMGEKIRTKATEVTDRSVEVAQKYPLHTALAALGTGIVLGMALASIRIFSRD